MSRDGSRDGPLRLRLTHAGMGRALEDFRAAEALRIALGQERTVGLSREESSAESRALEEIAASVGLRVDNELFEAFSQQLIVEDDFDEREGEEESEMYCGPPTPPTEVLVKKLARETVVVEDEDEEPASLGEFIGMLPQEQLEFVLSYLDEDSLDMCKVCNRIWRTYMESETLWKLFCERIFVKPAFRPIQTEWRDKRLVPKRFGSWLMTKRRRPHVRTETGLYIMKSTYIKDTGPPSMWTTEYKPYCEVHHYRYFLFKANGEVLYASTPLNLAEMREKFKRKLFEDYLDEGVCHRDPNATTFFPITTNLAQAADLPQASGRPTSMKQRGRFLRKHAKKSDTTKADTIYRGFYTVVGDKLTVVINLINFSVTFTMEIVSRGGSFDRLHTILHQSIYHKTGEQVLTYALSHNYCDRLFDYYAFNFPFDP